MTRIIAHANSRYVRSGLKSYVWLLQKYNIKPTLEGPYFRPEGHAFHNRQRHGGLKGLKKRKVYPYLSDQGHHHGHHHEHFHQREHRHHDHGHGCGCPGSSDPPPNTGSGPGSGSGSGTAPPASGSGSGSASGTEVSAQDQQNDSQYLCQVTIGGQTVNLDFDSGSSDLWVFSTHLPSSTQSQLKSSGHNVYDPSKAKAVSGATWNISYGDGSSASGDVVTDTLVIGDITVENQAIECAKTASSSFTQGVGDGLMGLAMGSINTVTPTKVQTPVENMISQQDIPQSQELFTAYLSSYKDTDEPDKGQSFYTFGTIDQTVMQRANATDFSWTPLVNQSIRGFWEFASTTWSLNGKTANRTAAQSGGNSAIADTGTTLALVDDATCKAIYAAIKGSKYDSTNQGYVIPSDVTEADLPDVGFAVGDKIFTVPKESLLFAETEPGWVYGGIQSRGDQTFDILGDVFLKGIYACFDQGNTRFGAVQRTLESQNLTVPSSTSGGSSSL